MEKYRILFVDDQPKVLDGLGRALRQMRSEWEMDFVESGPAALAAMERQHYHIVVTDMRMPEMNGAQLLKRISELYPGTVRFILSGHSDRELILQSVGYAHQYLAKPCEPEALRHMIENSMGLRKLLADEDLHEKIAKIDSLPARPGTYSQLLTELQAENTSINTIAEIIGRDVGLTAKILQMINSAFFGLPTHVKGVFQAVNLLGLDTVRSLVLAAGVFRQFESATLSAISIDAVYEHSIAVGAAAQKIATNLDLAKRLIDDALMAGMLHDVGKLVLAMQFPQEFQRARQQSVAEDIPFDQAERRVLRVSHAEIGAHLLSLWGLPDSIVEAVALHHQPSRAPSVVSNVLTAVYLANVLQHQLNQDRQSVDPKTLDWIYLDKIGLSERLTQVLSFPAMATI